MGVSDNDRWKDFRLQMPAAQQWAYFDHAAVAPLTEPARQALLRWTHEATDEGGPNWLRWNRQIEAHRQSAAQLVNAAVEEIGFIRSTCEGVTIVAEGFRWKPGDNVVLPADEYPSNQYPWINLESRGVEVRRVLMEGGRLDLNRLDDACDKRTRIVALSWVGFLSGWRTDLNTAAKMAHRHGALLFADVIQGLGALPLDVRATDIDFFAADGHKWMLGPEGAGLLYIRRNLLDELRPILVGATSVTQGNDYTRIEMNLKPSAARYEGGSPNSVGILAFGASLQMLAEYGLEAIGTRVLEVSGHCKSRLKELGAQIYGDSDDDQNRSGIVAFDFPGRDCAELRRECLARNVLLSHRGGRLRISPHVYISKDDVEQLMDALKAGLQTNT